MDPKSTVQALMYAIQMGDFEKTKSFLSNDFEFSGPVTKSISADAWLGLGKSLKKAFPNLEYHFRVESVQSGGIVKVSSELKGTHKGDLDLTSMNMGVVPATNKSFAAGREHGKITIKRSKATSWTVRPAEGAGLAAILDLLNVQLPVI